MAWNKSNNGKTAYVDYCGNLVSGYVGTLAVQSGTLFNGIDGQQTVIRTQFVNIHNKPAIPEFYRNQSYWQGLGSVLVVAQERLSNGYTYSMPMWSDKPFASMNFPTGITISGILYQPFRITVCNAGANRQLEFLGRLV